MRRGWRGRRPKWRRVPGVVTHVFTHFPLQLVVYAATVGAETRPPAGARWVALAALAGEALPNLMRKVLAHAVPPTRPIANVAPAALMDAHKRSRRAT